MVRTHRHIERPATMPEVLIIARQESRALRLLFRAHGRAVTVAPRGAQGVTPIDLKGAA